MSPLGGTCPEPPSPWGRLAFPRRFPLTPGPRQVPGTPVFPLPPCPPRRSQAVPLGGRSSPLGRHRTPAALPGGNVRTPKREVGTNGQASCLRVHSTSESPGAGPQASEQAQALASHGTRLLPSGDTTSCRESGEHWPLRSVPSECCHCSGGRCHMLCSGKVILPPAKMKN